ncbi:MAG: UDP-galactopyranose mutase [Coriobacteriales bacterium]|nr:UDP-galactopyranose mutase [Coriobacteriales bacterium]
MLQAGVDVLVVGAGFAGAVVARELAERANKKVLVIDQRAHVGGNAYDTYDKAGVLIHTYGPHIFHTNFKRAYDYLSRFTAWRNYQHEVLANIYEVYTPVPFNFNSIEMHFEPSKARLLIDKLTESFGPDTKVPIIELRKSADPLLSELADFVYEKVFLQYTLKQWGVTPEEVDESVTARVPVYTGRDNRYFTDAWQGMPLEGYTPLFDALLAHENISVVLGLDARDLLSFSRTPDPEHQTPAEAEEPQPFTTITAAGQPFEGTVVYTGPLDFLADLCFGMLPYRSLNFIYKTLPQKHFQPVGTVNYTVSEDFTRLTEFTWLTGQDIDHTTIMEEYSLAFENQPGQVPYYAILDPANQEAYERYLALFARLPDFHVLGRLAEYRYYNMDQIIERALDLADELCADWGDACCAASPCETGCRL